MPGLWLSRQLYHAITGHDEKLFADSLNSPLVVFVMLITAIRRGSGLVAGGYSLASSSSSPHFSKATRSKAILPPLLSLSQVDFLLQLVALKVLATAICRGSGLVGGFYAPSLFIGAALGQAYGRLASDVLVAVDPEYNLQWIQVAAPQAYAMVGMAATLAGVCLVPLTSVLLLFELTRDYRIILPLMAAVGIAAWIAAPATTPPSSPSPTAPAAEVAAAPMAVSPTATSQQSTSSSLPPVPPSLEATPATPSSPCSPFPTPLPLAISFPWDFTDFSDDSASLDVRDGVLLEEQVQRDLPVSTAMRPASSPSLAAVPLLLVRPRGYRPQGRGDGEAGYRPQGIGVRDRGYMVQERGGGGAENRASTVGVATPDSNQGARGVGEVEYRPSTVGEAVAAMVASRQWCCVVVGDGGRLEGLLTLVDVQQEVERRVAAERRGAGRGGRGGRRGRGVRRARGGAGGEGREGAGEGSSGESDGSGGEDGTGAADGGIAARVSTANVTVKGVVEGLPVSVLCTPWQQLETISPGASLYEARRRLTARGIRQLPMVLQVATRRGEGKGGEGQAGEGNEEGEDERGVEGGGTILGTDEVGRETRQFGDGEGREERGSDLLLVGLLDRDDIARACRAEATKRLLQL
ncbi:unnamed protein product [Closterium sp. Naga37s-1]|nr:unnamed protein product [Closterium sp. Naga37s-1]